MGTGTKYRITVGTWGEANVSKGYVGFLEEEGSVRTTNIKQHLQKSVCDPHTFLKIYLYRKQ